jgi:putative DNA methylase
MIERWFPCTEVSEASERGWGSGQSEKALFTWFATRPLAQAKAAVLTSLLPWPDETAEQRRLQDLVHRAMLDHDGAWGEVVTELRRWYPNGASILDPFSGRAVIPLEAARLGIRAEGIDYSPVATLAGQLLADYPLRDWSNEPELPFGRSDLTILGDRLLTDVRQMLDEIGRRYEYAMASFYPRVDGKQPWGYLWAVTLPCQECGRRFPLTGSLALRNPLPRNGDPGQSFRIEVDRDTGQFRAVVHDGPPTGQPTLAATTRGSETVRGKSAFCPFCGHVHPKPQHTRLAAEGLGEDALLVAADLDETVGKLFREPTAEERDAAARAEQALAEEPQFAPGVPAVPNEPIPAGNNDTVRASAYGAKTYGELCNARQNLGFVRLCRIIAELGQELSHDHAVSPDYASALCGYAASVVVRRLRRSTRGSTLHSRKDPKSNRVHAHDIFKNEAALTF